MSPWPCVNSRWAKRQTFDAFDPMHCVAMIPCFNEAKDIYALVTALRPYVPAVSVIDDGSTDETAELAKTAGATVLAHERNLGKGAALKKGFCWAIEEGYHWAITMDGDGQHAPDDIPLLFRCARETGAALVIGNRMHEAGKMCWLRRQVNFFMSWQLSRRARRELPDTQCGLRLIHLPTWQQMTVKSNRFEIESEMLMAFLAVGERVEFVPIQVIPSQRKSRIRPVLDTVRWLKWACVNFVLTKRSLNRKLEF